MLPHRRDPLPVPLQTYLHVSETGAIEMPRVFPFNGFDGAGAHHRWGATALLAALLVCRAAAPAGAVPMDISADEARRLGQRIYLNECAGRRECLLHWNAHEDFMSLGIGHFIWYPAGRRAAYGESFPRLVGYLSATGTPPPAVLTVTDGATAPCPWPDRQAFEADRGGATAAVLMAYLEATLDGQVRFMMRRLDAAWPAILAAAPPDRRDQVRRRFARLARTPRGRYALVDYVNFKGEGLLAAERIGGHGWGLLQVLLEMDDVASVVDPLSAFAAAADRVLTRRAESDPRPHVSAQWLPGWRRRLATYLAPAY